MLLSSPKGSHLSDLVSSDSETFPYTDRLSWVIYDSKMYSSEKVEDWLNHVTVAACQFSPRQCL